MRKMTLLEMTQNILNAMSSDEVNSISDTVESMQVAEEIRTTFYDLYSNRDMAEFEGVVNLQAVGNAALPNRLVFPDNVLHIKWLKYMDHRTGKLKYVDYLNPEEFIRRIVDMDESQHGIYADVELLATSPLTYSIRANKAPDYFTVFDNDKTLVFDSFDAEYESFLTSSNALAWGVMSVDFILSDDFVPPIDANLFPHLLAEAKSSCFVNYKEVANPKEDQKARRHLVRSQTRLTKTPEQREGVFAGNDYSRNRGVRSVFRRRNRWGS